MLPVLVAFLVGAVALLAAGAQAERPVVQDLGVLPNGPVLLLARGETACQAPIGLAEDVRRIGIVLGPFATPRGPVSITIRRGRPDGPALATATFPEGPLPSGPVELPLSREVRGGQDIALCVRNGGEPLELIGDATASLDLPQLAGRVRSVATRSTDDLVYKGRALVGQDVSAYFPDTEPRSLLERLPAAFRHAAAFKLAGVGAWTYWTALVLLVLAGPWLLSRALSGTLRDDEPVEDQAATSRSSSAT